MRYLLFLTLLLACVSAKGENTKKSENEDSPYEQLEILTRAMQLIRQDYVNDSKTSYKELTYSALHGMLESLDPHSQFMEPKDFKSMQEDTKSEFAGLGVTLTEKSGILTILHPMEDTPGFEAGLLPGDQILKINGESTEKLNINSAIEKLRGKVGERVTLTINRPSTSQLKDFEIIRAIIKVPSVKDAQILPLQGKARIGYVRITQFNEPTATELANALNTLEKDGMEALVLDLRYNPGGLLGSAVDVCGEFLEPNTLIVFTEGRTPSREYRTATTSTSQREYPIVVLTNYASASGSEIVAGALKDLGRALLVGETTFGKGSVQSVVSLTDGSAARLTTAKYFTPSRKLIHEHGVSPHIRATLTREQETALLRSRRKGEESSTPPRLPADPQLDRAVDALQATILSNKTAQVRPAKK
jgi:carboxyl-terminal processing protease